MRVSPRVSPRALPKQSRKTIIAFRHGETDWNRKGIIQGRTDIPLNETGIQQAIKLAEDLKPYKIDAILTSPLTRAKQTAEIVQSSLKVPLHFDDRLVECNCGVFEGRTKDLDFFAKWESPQYPYIKPENGEYNRDIFDRAIQSVRDFIHHESNAEYETIAISTHGGVVRRLINFLTNTSGEAHIPNTFHIKMSYDIETDKFTIIT